MDQQFYVTWNNYTSHQLNCPKRMRWLDVFLSLVLKHQYDVPRFFRDISSVLAEQLLRDISRLADCGSRPEEVSMEKVGYCLRQRGWLLLHTLTLSNLQYLTGVAELTDLLTALYEMEGEDSKEEEEEEEDLPAGSSRSWPLSQLVDILIESDLKSRKPQTKILRRQSRKTDFRNGGSVAVSTNEMNLQLDGCSCCQNNEDDPVDPADADSFPVLSLDGFRRLILTLLESLVASHGDARLKSGQFLDELILKFALDRFHPSRDGLELRHLLRLILRSMVSHVGFQRSLPADEIIQHVIDVADLISSGNSAEYDADPYIAADVIEGVVRFLAAIQPIDDDVVFHQWLNSFHSQTCLRLVQWLLTTPLEMEWLALIGRILTNVTGHRGRLPCHHHRVYGRALDDPEHLNRQSCSVSSLFYILLEMYRLGAGRSREVALLAMSRAHPCCCLPPDIIHQSLFERVLEDKLFLDVLDVVFHHTGFAARSSSIQQQQQQQQQQQVPCCSICRNNGGVELERCMRMGAYSSVESLSQSYWNVSQPDPWRSFDLYADYIMERVEQPFALGVVKLLARLVTDATPQVQYELFARIFYPILALSSSSSATPESSRSLGGGSQEEALLLPPDRWSVLSQMTEVCWQVTSLLVEKRSIWELFVDSSGLELVMDFCRWPEWSASVFRVLEVMLLLQFQSEPIEPMDVGAPELQVANGAEATPLTVLEHLLLHHTTYLFRSLELNGSADVRMKAADAQPLSQWISSPGSVDSFESVWIQHLGSFENLPGDLKTTSALWETVVRLVIRNPQFSAWFQGHWLANFIQRGMLVLASHIANPDASFWFQYMEILEHFVALSLLTIPPSAECDRRFRDTLQRFTADGNLSLIYDLMLRCCTLERWLPNRSEGGRSLPPEWSRMIPDGYEADEEQVNSLPANHERSEFHPPLNLYFPAVIPLLLSNFAGWYGRMAADAQRMDKLMADFFCAFTRMASLCQHPPTAAILNGYHLQNIILGDLKALLISPNPAVMNIRQHLLRMVTSLSRQRMSSTHLQMLLDLFKEDAIAPPSTDEESNEQGEDRLPLKELLSTLLDLIQHDGNQPTHMLGFPANKVDDDIGEDFFKVDSALLGPFIHLNEVRVDLYSLAKHAMELGRAHEVRGLVSAWRWAAVFLPILSNQSWNVKTDGLSLSSWIFLVEKDRKTENRERVPVWNVDIQDYSLGGMGWSNIQEADFETDGDMHLFSFGTKNLLVELWADATTESTILVRLSQSTATSVVCLSSHTLNLKIPTGKWNHLAVTCRQRSFSNQQVVDMNVILNGLQSAALQLKVPYSPVKRMSSSNSFLLIGIAGSNTQSPRPPSWYLGHTTLYKGEILTAEKAILLMALGPDNIFLASCQHEQLEPNFARYLNPKLSSRLQDWDQVFNYEKLMPILQANLVLTYSAHKPDSVFIYAYIISPTAAGLFGSMLGGSTVYNAVSLDPRSSQQPPITLPVATTSTLTTLMHTGIRTAMKEVGGSSVLLFLLGHMIQLRSGSCIQAKALEILLSWLRCDAREMQLFRANSGPWMLQHALQVERCHPGKHVAAVLLNLCCSNPLVSFPSGGTLYKISTQSDSVIVDSKLLVFALQCWKHWQRQPDYTDAQGTTLSLVLRIFQNLLKDNHPHRDFNVHQMEAAKVLDHLLYLGKENSLYKEYSLLTEDETLQMADLIEGLLGSPPKMDALTAIMEYLLLLHPAEETFAAYAVSNFYFLVSPRDSAPDVFKPRGWKLPDGYETYAPEASDLQPMNTSRLGSALRDVHIKWINDSGQDNRFQDNQHLQVTLPESHPPSMEYVRDEADISLSLQLLRMLTACVRVLPDSMIKPVVTNVIRPDVLLVMTHHKSDRIRAAVVKLLHATLMRSEEEQQWFLRNGGLILLANQLQPFRSTPAVAESCLVFCVGVDVILEQILLDPFSIWPENPTTLQLQSMILIMSLLPNSALDPALFHQLATLIRTLITKSSGIMKFLLDFGLVEILGKSIVALAHANHSVDNDVLQQREDEILIDALHRILILIAARTVYASGSGSFTVFQDMLSLLQYMSRVECGLCRVKARCVRQLEDSCCIVLKQGIQTLQDLVEIGAVDSGMRNAPSESLHFQKTSEKLLWNYLPPMLNRKIKLDKAAASSSELLDRFRFLLTRSVDQVLLCVEREMSPQEINFAQGLFLTLVRGLSSLLERPKSSRNSADATTDWSHYHSPDYGDRLRLHFWNCRHVVKGQLNRLLLFLTSPVHQPYLLYFVIRTLYEDPRHEEIFKLIPSNEGQFKLTLDMYLCHFLHSRNCNEDVEHKTLIQIHRISRCLVPCHPPPPHPHRKCQVLDTAVLRRELIQQRDRWWKHQEETQLRILSRFDVLYRSSTDPAIRLTHQAVAMQHATRRIFLDRLRRDHGDQVLAAGSWTELVAQMTHQRAAWYFPRSYLQGWQLSCSEGSQRMHIRLERCALEVDEKYVLERSRHILDPERESQPLESILQRSSLKSIKDVIRRGENVMKMINCSIVTCTNETSGELVLTDRWMTLVTPADPASYSTTCWKYDDIREILPRRFQLQDRGLELFMCDNRTSFIVFSNQDQRNEIIRQLSELCVKLIPPESLLEVTQLWRENQITNFEYLIFLNKMAGRSYNDLMQYPIFPFVLSDYESGSLNLDDPHVYRNFKKPMAIQNEHRDNHYIENYNYLKKDFENRPEGAGTHGPNMGPFHYGSLYSNPGIVLHFLVRLPPFTKLLLDYQDRSFDVPDRSFHSVGVSWRLASSDSTTDVKELIPEFFYLPEFLINSQGFDFGIQQSGDAVDDVHLPPWCQGDPRLFILIHRQALESSWVRDHLHHWIDLIFGFKQSGPAAIDSINVFHPATYAGFDLIESSDPIDRSAKLTMIRSYGQVPRQLFRQPHPMSIQSLSAACNRRSNNLLPSVDNLQWGCFVGSPSCQDPILKHKESFAVPVHSFLALRTGDTYTLGPFTAAILAHSYDKDSFLGRPTGILGVGLIQWGQADGIVRIKIRKDEPIKPLFQSEAHDAVMLCSTAPDYHQIWVGYRSGLIRVYPFSYDPLRSQFELTGTPAILTGHYGPIQHLTLCSEFSVAISAGRDGSVIIWDLYLRHLIRQFIPGHSSCNDDFRKRKDEYLPVAQLAISRNSADIACVVHSSVDTSQLELRSVNGALIATTTTSPVITSLCFSSAPEGVSINVVAGGLANGVIRLWNTWTLTAIRDIRTDSILPIVSLAYSSLSQHLLAARNDGSVLVWESAHNHKKSSRHLPFISLTLQ